MIRALLIGEGKNVHYTEKPVVIETAYKTKRELLWLDLLSPTACDLEFLSVLFQFDEHSLENCQKNTSFSGVEEYDEYLYLVTHVLENSESVSFPTLHIFLGKQFLVTVHDSSMNELEEYWNRVLRQLFDGNQGLGFMLYNIFDCVGDTYLKAIEEIADMIEDIEGQIFGDEPKGIMIMIKNINRKLIIIRRQLNSEISVMDKITRPDLEFFTRKNRLLMLDILEKFSRILHFVEINRELTHSLLEDFLTMLSLQANETSIQQNKIMQRLTVITAVFLPLTLIAGIYGMNFDNMPELEWRYGYFLVLGIMVLLGILLYEYFKAKKWLE